MSFGSSNMEATGDLGKDGFGEMKGAEIRCLWFEK